MSQNTATYKDAGVDIDAGEELVSRIKPFAKATRRLGSMDDLGGFGALFDLKAAGFKDPLLISSTDGVGTKLKIAQAAGKHDSIGIDLVAMCVNDLVVQGGEPLFFLDYFATGKLSVDTAEQVIKGIAEGCKQAGCALIVERGQTLPTGVQEGDTLLGIASSGVHSNGFSLVRHIMKIAGLDFASAAPFAPGKTLGEALLVPTKIYVKSCLAAIRAFPGDVKALAHITGGGLTENLPRVLPHELGALIESSSWQLPGVFQWLKDAGNVPQEDMWRTFNCGIGMVMVVSSAKATAVAKKLTEQGETVYTIGQLTARSSHPVVIK